MTRKDDITGVRERVEVDLRHHTYVCLCSSETVETWLCKRPGTNCYLLTITITPYNIFVGGDIDAVAYRVGSRYGFGFLAGQGASGYAQSKLEHVYSSDKVLDEDAIIDYALRHYWSNLHEYDDDEDTQWGPKPGEGWDAYVKRSVAAIYGSWDDPDHGHKGELDSLVEFLHIDNEDDDAYISDDMEVREVMDALSDIGIIDSWECEVTKPKLGLLYTMEAAAYAARKILEIKSSASAQQQLVDEATGQV